MSNNFKLGYYKKPFQHDYIEVTLARVLKNFMGKNFQQVIEEARCLYNEGQSEAYVLFKNKLPAITFSGTFKDKRTASNIQSYSGLIVLDVDKIGKNLNEVKERIFNDEFVLAVWISPSGDGLKFLIKTDREAIDHKKVYKNALIYFSKKFEINVDKSGSDISRLCFVSFDKELKHKDNCTSFNDNSIPLLEKQITRIKTTNPFTDGDRKVVREVSSNQNAQKKILRKIYFFLKKRNLSITSTHEEWIKIAFAISNTFTYEVGRRYFMEFCRLDGNEHNEEECEKLIENCYRKGTTLSSFKSILYIAQLKGYQIGFSNRKIKPKSN